MRKSLAAVLGIAAGTLLLSNARADIWTEASCTVANLFQLNAGEGHYEAWIRKDGVMYSLGKFNMDPDAQHMQTIGGVPLDYLAAPGDLTGGDYVMITVEQEGDIDAVPSNSKLLAGPIVGSTANLLVKDPEAIGKEFGPTLCKGSFHLDSPSTASATDFYNGIWYYRHSDFTPTLTVPTLPSGWRYEGWVGDACSADPIPYSTGEYSSATGADMDGCGGGAGPDPCPEFPGQDFVFQDPENPNVPYGANIQLNNGCWQVVHSIEPVPNTGPNPFHSLEPLQLSKILGNPGQYQRVDLNNTATLFPMMTVTLVTAAAKPVTWGEIKSLYRAH